MQADGQKRIEWAARDMPVLAAVKARFEKERPFDGIRISCCLHVTTETANLMLTLQAGGADASLCASNPLSTQDDVVAALTAAGVKVYAKKGEDRDSFFANVRAAIEDQPQITIDDGADLVSVIHGDYPSQASELIASLEETTTGVIRLRAMARNGVLKAPVIAVNDARTKNLFDNRYGTGQSTLEGIIRATGMLLAGKVFVVAGYGWCGKGLALRARGMGAQVVVTEVDAVKALEAAMDGFRVLPMAEAAPIGDVFCTVTGNTDVVTGEHFKLMKDGAVACNSGHFDVEVSVKDLERIAAGRVREVHPNLKEYLIPAEAAPGGSEGVKRVYLLAEGRLVNLAAAEGHPASVMDMSFATQALAAEWALKNRAELRPQVYAVAAEIEEYVAALKLASMGLQIDKLTPEQEEYLSGWEKGT